MLCPTVVACAGAETAPVCALPLKPAVEVNLYLGRDKPAGGEVSDAEWASFLADTVTPRFPAGLTPKCPPLCVRKRVQQCSPETLCLPALAQQ